MTRIIPFFVVVLLVLVGVTLDAPAAQRPIYAGTYAGKTAQARDIRASVSVSKQACGQHQLDAPCLLGITWYADYKCDDGTAGWSNQRTDIPPHALGAGYDERGQRVYSASSIAYGPSGGAIRWRIAIKGTSASGWLYQDYEKRPAPDQLYLCYARAPSGSEQVPFTATNPVHCTVPDVRGRKLAQAKRAIRAAYCDVGDVKKKKSSAKPGRVLSEKPSAGKRVPAGSTVSLVVSKK